VLGFGSFYLLAYGASIVFDVEILMGLLIAFAPAILFIIPGMSILQSLYYIVMIGYMLIGLYNLIMS